MGVVLLLVKQTSLNEQEREYKKRTENRKKSIKEDLSFGSNEIITQVAIDHICLKY